MPALAGGPHPLPSLLSSLYGRQPQPPQPPRPSSEAEGCLPRPPAPSPPKPMVPSPPAGGGVCLRWLVEAHMIESDAPKVALQPFLITLPGRGQCTFKASLFADARNHKCSGMGFQNAKGRGRVELKCEAPAPERAGGCLSVAVAVGAEGLRQEQGPRLHDFSKQSCCAFRKWDFRAAVDPSTQSFAVEVTLTLAVHAER